jgi:hypothetical protein
MHVFCVQDYDHLSNATFPSHPAPPYGKIITQKLKRVIISHSYSDYVKMLATFHSVAVKMVRRIVLESTSIFQCVPDIVSRIYLRG